MQLHTVNTPYHPQYAFNPEITPNFLVADPTRDSFDQGVRGGVRGIELLGAKVIFTELYHNTFTELQQQAAATTMTGVRNSDAATLVGRDAGSITSAMSSACKFVRKQTGHKTTNNNFLYRLVSTEGQQQLAYVEDTMPSQYCIGKLNILERQLLKGIAADLSSEKLHRMLRGIRGKERPVHDIIPEDQIPMYEHQILRKVGWPNRALLSAAYILSVTSYNGPMQAPPIPKL